jgi:uncharacterized DUF497 family protein
LIVQGVNFEWDSRKSASNLRKHHVGFEEASTVFGDQLSVTIADPDHASEERFVIIGMSLSQRLLVVVHTMRGERIRLISARIATNHEKRVYQEGPY